MAARLETKREKTAPGRAKQVEQESVKRKEEGGKVCKLEKVEIKEERRSDWRMSKRTERRDMRQSGGVKRAEDEERASVRSQRSREEAIRRELRKWRSKGSRKIDGNGRGSFVERGGGRV